MQQSLYDLRPLLSIMVMGALLALGVMAYWWVNHGKSHMHQRSRQLVALVLFLTFDLVVFCAFARLTESGLGCPDWPGCYGHASPIGAQSHIDAAEQAMPTGPVTHEKAWIEMIHRYLATAVGVLIIALWVHSIRFAPAQRTWTTITLIWVLIQGAFGALTVTLKLMPLVVTLHLLGGLMLLSLLTVQLGRLTVFDPMSQSQRAAMRPWLLALSIALVMQVSLGGWVSTNYAVLACPDFPSCLNGSWWPDMDFDAGFDFFRPLGKTPDGETLLSVSALTAIHMAHRIGAILVVTLALLCALIMRSIGMQTQSTVLLCLLILQVMSGVSNVIFQWPLIAALLHTAGAALWVMGLVWLWMSLRDNSQTDQLTQER